MEPTTFGTDLASLVQIGYDQNPSIQATGASSLALMEKAKAGAVWASPTVGWSQLDRGMSTRYWSISQKIEFPTKYGLREDIDRQLGEAKHWEREHQKMRIRAQIISLYYGIYAVRSILSLTEDDLGKVREFSRIAEMRYAAGKAAMHDTMKAHVLQTQIEADLIALRDEEQSLQARLRHVLGQPPSFSLATTGPQPETPRLLQSWEQLAPSSPLVSQKVAEERAASLGRELSDWDLAPDFHIRYQERLSGEPRDSRSLTLEMSLPLWFWGKSAAQRAASHTAASKGFEVESARQSVQNRAREQYQRAESQKALLDLMKTALIPQAQTTFAATLDAYKAGKSSFLELLDGERSLLKAQISYHRMHAQYVENITALETTLGKPVSNLAR